MTKQYQAFVRSTGGESKQGGVTLMPGTCYGYGPTPEVAMKDLIAYCPQKYWIKGAKPHIRVDNGLD